jgi:hypothetical protein
MCCALMSGLSTCRYLPLPSCPCRSSSPTGLPAATVIGRNVTIGQACLLRSVTVEDEAVIGDKCVLLEGSMVEKHAGEEQAAAASAGGIGRVGSCKACWVSCPHTASAGAMARAPPAA